MKKYLVGFLLVTLSLNLVNCGTETEEQDNSALVYYLITEKNYTSEQAYRELGFGIDDMHRTLYNSLLAGQSVLAANILLASTGIDGNCSLGGSVKLTGSASALTDATKVNLIFTFNGCKQIYTSKTSSTALTLNGSSSKVGTIGTSSNDYKIASSALILTGTQSNSNFILGTPVEFSNTSCEVSITNSSSFSGSICGTNFTNTTTTTTKNLTPQTNNDIFIVE